MQLTELQILENLKNGDIRSAMDQLRLLIKQNNDTQNNIKKIFEELDKKVNLKSKYLTELNPVTEIGTGVITVSGLDIIGIGTLFTNEIIIGNSIKVGTETRIIDSIIDDTHATITESFTTDSSNQVYGIVKLISRELLTGNFEFGQTNAETFNGVINKSSTFQHYGRMTHPYDIINVQFAQRLFNPAMARAMNAIQRDGDTVGLETLNGEEKYNYLLRNLTWNFNPTTEAYYNGLINAERRDSFVNLGYVNDIINNVITTFRTEFFFARWVFEQQSSMGNTLSILGATWNSPFINGPEEHDNFYPYFSVTPTGLKCLIPCVVEVTLDAWADFVYTGIHTPYNGSGIQGMIYNSRLNKIYTKSVDHSSASDSHASFRHFNVSCSTVIKCVKDDVIVTCIGTIPGGAPSNIHTYCSISRMR